MCITLYTILVNSQNKKIGVEGGQRVVMARGGSEGFTPSGSLFH